MSTHIVSCGDIQYSW